VSDKEGDDEMSDSVENEWSGAVITPSSDAVRAGIRAEMMTIVLMIAEATVAIIAGIRARSVLITAIGLDGAVELISALVLVWRLRHHDSEDVERVEHRAAQVSAWLLVALCAYVAVSTAVGAIWRIEPEESMAGLAISVVVAVFMPLLAAWKRRVNVTLRSAAMRADIAETLACGYMAWIVIGGVALHRMFGLWWIEYAATVLLFVWLVHETKEAFERAEDD